MTKYFAWTDCGPQIWYDKPTDGNGKSKPAKFIRKLEPYEENLSLDELAKIYKDKKGGTEA